jgi:hypothetical protein
MFSDYVGLINATADKPWLMILMTILILLGGSTAAWKFWSLRYKLIYKEKLIEAEAEAKIDLIKAETAAKIKLAEAEHECDREDEEGKLKKRKPKTRKNKEE